MLHCRCVKVKTLITAFIFGTFVYGVFPYLFIRLNDYFSLPFYTAFGMKFMGIVIGIAGFVIWIYTGALFRVAGQGTPVPTDPPKKLVITGIYNYSRNPMYLGMFLILIGYFLFSGYLTLLAYLILSIVFFSLVVSRLEEPVLRKKFGEAYENYCQKVPRWF